MSKLTHYVVALTDNPREGYDVAPVHINAENREQAAQEGLKEIIDRTGLTAGDLVGYDVGVAPNSSVTYYRIDTAAHFQLTKQEG